MKETQRATDRKIKADLKKIIANREEIDHVIDRINQGVASKEGIEYVKTP